MELLRLVGLSKYYTSQSSVVMGITNINLTFDKGEFVAITGESGSGKSTLAKVLSGILPYEAGELYIQGEPTSHFDGSDLEEYRRDAIGYISQNYDILEGNTVLENVECALILCGFGKAEAKEKASDILRKVELSEYAERKAAKLSSGQKQRLSIARALAKPSAILIADEPTGNLDSLNSRKVVELLKKASEDRLVIIVTHEFSEVEDLVTRRITLAEGAVVSDRRFVYSAPTEEKRSEQRKEKTDGKATDKKPKLPLFVAAMLTKARPVFSSIICVLLALTTVLTFVFLGSFTVALDDTSTKIYSSKAFMNPDPERLMVMRADHSLFTEEDYAAIADIRRVASLERYGYATDMSYYYKKDVDYRINTQFVNGPNYHPAFNPTDIHIVNTVEFLAGESYMRSLPSGDSFKITEGTAPADIYEVVSADRSHNIGDRITVYFKNEKNWNMSAYIALNLKVVGKTSFGEGLYFSDELTVALSGAMEDYKPSRQSAWQEKSYVFLPYDEEALNISFYRDSDGYIRDKNGDRVDTEKVEAPEENISFKGNFALYPSVSVDSKSLIGEDFGVRGVDYKKYFFNCEGVFESSYERFIVTDRATFDAATKIEAQNQVAVYIKDYAYTDRVMDKLADCGYLALSPYRLGATEVDTDLATERIVTLAVSLAAFILSLVLQLILLKTLFGTLSESLNRMSNIGLTAATAYKAVLLMLLAFTLVGELVGGGAVLLLHSLGVARVTAIVKYLDGFAIALLFLVHFLLTALCSFGVISTLKKNVFYREKRVNDLDMGKEGA